MNRRPARRTTPRHQNISSLKNSHTHVSIVWALIESNILGNRPVVKLFKSEQLKARESASADSTDSRAVVC